MPRRSKPGKRWSMHPSLHDQVSSSLEEYGLRFEFYENDDSNGCTRDKDTNIMGRFACHNGSCASKGWSSKKIAITIRMYPGQRYNARVYHQRCKSCNKLGQLHLDEETYVERVSYRIKIWTRVIQPTKDHNLGISKGPHNRDLCEGCKAGHCKAGEDEDDLAMQMQALGLGK